MQRRLGLCRCARRRDLQAGAEILGLDPVEYSYDECSKDAAAVNSEKGREVDRRLRDYCAAHTALEVETALNAAKIGCARVFNVRDQYNDEHYAASVI